MIERTSECLFVFERVSVSVCVCVCAYEHVSTCVRVRAHVLERVLEYSDLQLAADGVWIDPSSQLLLSALFFFFLFS
jgi:hypothetical protein